MIIDVKATKAKSEADPSERYALKSMDKKSNLPILLGGFATCIVVYVKSLFMEGGARPEQPADQPPEGSDQGHDRSVKLAARLEYGRSRPDQADHCPMHLIAERSGRRLRSVRVPGRSTLPTKHHSSSCMPICAPTGMPLRCLRSFRRRAMTIRVPASRHRSVTHRRARQAVARRRPSRRLIRMSRMRMMSRMSIQMLDPDNRAPRVTGTGLSQRRLGLWNACDRTQRSAQECRRSRWRCAFGQRNFRLVRHADIVRGRMDLQRRADRAGHRQLQGH